MTDKFSFVGASSSSKALAMSVTLHINLLSRMPKQGTYESPRASGTDAHKSTFSPSGSPPSGGFDMLAVDSCHQPTAQRWSFASLTCCSTSMSRLLCASCDMFPMPPPLIASVNCARALLASWLPDSAALVAWRIVSIAAVEADEWSSVDPDRMSDSSACTRTFSS